MTIGRWLKHNFRLVGSDSQSGCEVRLPSPSNVSRMFNAESMDWFVLIVISPERDSIRAMMVLHGRFHNQLGFVASAFAELKIKQSHMEDGALVLMVLPMLMYDLASELHQQPIIKAHVFPEDAVSMSRQHHTSINMSADELRAPESAAARLLRLPSQADQASEPIRSSGCSVGC